ncbi:hypothetical protein CH375_00595 [Leptospira ellisii]|uniref:Uncharacterized protein n=1 Tax=Leptospira ellisii TaxID=2023197 RepID=A0A2N0BDK9_9LEPT|nr:hypothetical protein CH379_01710 [Leptospira ellisii]PKA06276.1 hypothetical protein CH375_00595 [Leptospira ellisii]
MKEESAGKMRGIKESRNCLFLLSRTDRRKRIRTSERKRTFMSLIRKKVEKKFVLSLYPAIEVR